MSAQMSNSGTNGRNYVPTSWRKLKLEKLEKVESNEQYKRKKTRFISVRKFKKAEISHYFYY